MYLGAELVGQMYDPYTEDRLASAFTIAMATARFSAGWLIVLER